MASDMVMRYCGPTRLSKQLELLKGIFNGITADNIVSRDEANELFNWCILNKEFQGREPFRTLIPAIEGALEDNEISDDELADILWIIDSFEHNDVISDIQTSMIQTLHGLLHGILADGHINNTEIFALERWIEEHDFLKGTFPYDEIDSVLTSILADGEVSADERDLLTAIISEFIDCTCSVNINQIEMAELKKKYSVGGICAVNPDMTIKDKLFCFTGESTKVNRKEFAQFVEERGGRFHDKVVKDTDYLVIGSSGCQCWIFASYGRKVEAAQKLRRDGGKIVLISEIDFWDCID